MEPPAAAGACKLLTDGSRLHLTVLRGLRVIEQRPRDSVDATALRAKAIVMLRCDLDNA